MPETIESDFRNSGIENLTNTVHPRDDDLLRRLRDSEDIGLSKEEKINAIIEFSKMASPQSMANVLGRIDPSVLEAIFKGVAEEASSVPAGPVPRPADAPPLWAERKPGWNTTGKKSSCALWIKMHYGNKDPENWDPMELQLKDLRHDKALYDAFAKWIETHPEDDFDPQVRRQVVRYTDPKEAVERLRGQKRASEARLRKVR